MAKEFGQSL